MLPVTCNQLSNIRVTFNLYPVTQCTENCSSLDISAKLDKYNVNKWRY